MTFHLACQNLSQISQESSSKKWRRTENSDLPGKCLCVSAYVLVSTKLLVVFMFSTCSGGGGALSSAAIFLFIRPSIRPSHASSSTTVHFVLRLLLNTNSMPEVEHSGRRGLTATWSGRHGDKVISGAAIHAFAVPVTSRCPACRHRTWPTTAVLLPMLVSGDCVPQRAKHASWRRHTAPSATEHSQLPAPDYGTVFHRTWKTLTYCTVNSGGRWRHFCLDSGAMAQCELVLTAPYRNIYTYLLTINVLPSNFHQKVA